MGPIDDLGFPALILLIAGLFASVGQAGASGYLAAMGLAGLAPEVMKPTALALNVLVAAIGTLQFWRAGLFSWRAFYPFGVLGFPFSIIGGAIHLPTRIYYPVVGAVLLLAAFQMLRSATRRASAEVSPKPPPFLPALLTGASIGFVSGVMGTGGGIFLAPIILLMNWSDARRVAPIAAAYNLLNSAAALAGAYSTLNRLPSQLPGWMLAAALGAIVGSTLGSRYLPERALRYILAGLLLVSGAKLLLS
jgi:uncharacterized membrane protein YfcA